MTSYNARLLDKVAYCMRKECDTTDIEGLKLRVRDAFPYNPESKTAPETAKRWATGYGYGSDKDHVPEVVVRDNDPFQITITDLEHRGEGGRAYKVVDSAGRRFDLREDQLIEVIKNVGIQPGGVIPGSFVWGMWGSQMHLVLVDGALHKTMAEGARARKESDRAKRAGEQPTVGTLVPGHVYRKKDDSIHVFLGKVKREDSGKILYAFMQMPNVGEPQESTPIVETDSVWEKQRKYRCEVSRRWATMTWREKCQFAWDDDYNKHKHTADQEKYIRREAIVLLSSPKFEVDVGVLEKDFFEELKDNPENKHDYTDGFGSSLVRDEFLQAHPDEKGYLTSGDTWHSYKNYYDKNATDDSEQMTKAWHAHKEVFYKGLKWK